jgi:phosphohistidine phosphatase SixA
MACLGLVTGAHAQALSGKALVDGLRRGGYVIVMRHASSPRDAPDERTANPDNVERQRQLDEAGRAGATAMGRAIRTLDIPIGDVYTSPTYRGQETVRFAQLPNAKPIVELGDGGQSMQGVTDAQSAWLRKKVTEIPKGTNTFVVTHLPNIANAFPKASDVLDGEALVFGHDSHGGTRIVARVKIDEWPRMRR